LSANQLDLAWQQVLSILEQEVSIPALETWFFDTRPVTMHGRTLVLAAPNEFARDYLQSRYYPLVKATLERVLGREPITIQVICFPPAAGGYRAVLAPENEDNDLPRLNPRYTFDSFVVGNSNRFAQAACLAVAETPANSYNPLFIYGGVGLGKTHLMQAIGHQVRHHLPDFKVLYISSERFTNDLINAIKDEQTEEFRTKYRNIDVLLIDDIQFLAKKESTQIEFFHTFNHLYEANKQIVISSDRPPKEIPTLEDRLRSRFEWGLITDIQPPDLETRVAILRKKAWAENITMPDEIMFFIAQKIESNIRELEGALIRVAAYAAFTKQEVTIPLAEKVLKEALELARPKPITIPLIQEVVTRYFNLKPDDLKAKKRNRAIAYPRQIAMYLCREMIDASLPQIGTAFGGRDHSTVIHACNKIRDDVNNDPSLPQILSQLMQEINNH